MNSTEKSLLTKGKFFKLLILLTIISISLLSGLAFYKLNSIKSSTIASIMNNTLNNIETEINISIKNIRSQIKIAQEWGNSGLINFEKPQEEIVSQFTPLLDQVDAIKSISIISSSGQSYVITKNGKLKLNHYFPSKQSKSFILNDSKQIISEKPLTSNEDLRKKDWYQLAMSKNDSIFTYDVLNPKNIGTLAIHWSHIDKKQSGVIAFEISINFVNQVYEKQQQNGYAFMFDKSGTILPIGGNVDNITNSSMIQKTIEHWKKSSQNEFNTYPFKEGTTLWWTGLKPLINNNNNIIIAVVTPEKEILPNISEQRNRWYIIIGAIIFTAIVLAFFLFRAYKHSLDHIDQLKDSTNIDSESKMLDLIQKGESSKLEFKSTVRMNLKSGKAGKEIEQAWLKNIVAFLNTEGGALLLGVDDDGVILGLEADNFKNKDNCMLHITNLIKQHIGLEFNSYMNIECTNVIDKEIVAIHVSKSPEPAFLHMNKEDEEFYIRSGPSCTKLTISKAIKYINDQKSKT